MTIRYLHCAPSCIKDLTRYFSQSCVCFVNVFLPDWDIIPIFTYHHQIINDILVHIRRPKLIIVCNHRIAVSQIYILYSTEVFTYRQFHYTFLQNKLQVLISGGSHMLAKNYTCLMMKKEIDAFVSIRSFSLPHRSQSWGVVLHPVSSVHIALDLLLPKMFQKCVCFATNFIF